MEKIKLNQPKEALGLVQPDWSMPFFGSYLKKNISINVCDGVCSQGLHLFFSSLIRKKRIQWTHHYNVNLSRARILPFTTVSPEFKSCLLLDTQKCLLNDKQLSEITSESWKEVSLARSGLDT